MCFSHAEGIGAGSSPAGEGTNGRLSDRDRKWESNQQQAYYKCASTGWPNSRAMSVVPIFFCTSTSTHLRPGSMPPHVFRGASGRNSN